MEQLVEALRYKPEGRGFDSRCCHRRNPSGRNMSLGLTQPLTEMSTRNISWGVKTADVWVRQPYHLHESTVLKSGNVKLLEPSGSVQGCTGSALPLPLLLVGDRKICHIQIQQCHNHLNHPEF